MVETAMKKGKDALISELRTKNIFPNHLYMAQIADAVIDLYETGSDQPSELSFDDLEYLAKEVSEQQRVLKEMGEETTEIDELLNDIDSGLDKKNDIKTISSPLDVVDDDVIGVGDDA
jgi:hypothetical protein